MKKIIIWGAYPSTLFSVRNGNVHINGFGDGLLWWLAALIPRFELAGYRIAWGDVVESWSPKKNGDDVAILLLLDLPNLKNPTTQHLFAAIPPSRRILMRLEPPAIAPASYTHSILNSFGALARVEPSIADSSVPHVIDFTVPLERELPVLQENDDNRKGICAVSSHKRIIGSRGSLYRLREQIYRKLSASPVNFTLYGVGWDNYVSGVDYLDWVIRRFNIRLPALAPCKLNYFGPVPNKSNVTRHNYSVVIENYIGKTYISEKPFDSLKYGVVPIYYGGVDLSKEGLGEIVIQAKKPSHIIEHALKLPPAQPQEIVRHIYANWLDSPRANKYRLESCFNNLKNLFEEVFKNE